MLNELGGLYVKLENYTQASATYRQVTEALSVEGLANPTYRTALRNLIVAEEHEGDHDTAEKNFKTLQGFIRNRYASDYQTLVSQYSQALRDRGNRKEADKLESEIKKP